MCVAHWAFLHVSVCTEGASSFANLTGQCGSRSFQGMGAHEDVFLAGAPLSCMCGCRRLQVKKDLALGKADGVDGGAAAAADGGASEGGESAESELDEEAKILGEMDELRAAAAARAKKERKKRREAKTKARVRAAQLALSATPPHISRHVCTIHQLISPASSSSPS